MQGKGSPARATDTEQRGQHARLGSLVMSPAHPAFRLCFTLPQHLDDNASQGSQQTGQAGASPSQSHMSDSDAATYRGGQEVDSHPSSFAADTPSQRQQGAAEPRSGAYHPHHHQHHQQQGGYTSDQSDIGRPPAPPLRRQRSGARRPTMPASAPIHVAPRASLLSSERIRISDQSGEGDSRGATPERRPSPVPRRCPACVAGCVAVGMHAGNHACPLFSSSPPPPPPPPPPPGIITLVFIILAATNFRLILENMIKCASRSAVPCCAVVGRATLRRACQAAVAVRPRRVAAVSSRRRATRAPPGTPICL